MHVDCALRRGNHESPPWPTKGIGYKVCSGDAWGFTKTSLPSQFTVPDNQGREGVPAFFSPSQPSRLGSAQTCWLGERGSIYLRQKSVLLRGPAATRTERQESLRWRTAWTWKRRGREGSLGFCPPPSGLVPRPKSLEGSEHEEDEWARRCASSWELCFPSVA